MRIGGDFSADFHFWSDTFAAVHTAYLVGQILEIYEWCLQLQLYNSLSIHDNLFNDLTQEFILVAAFQAYSTPIFAINPSAVSKLLM
jgi:hypothetical protein